MGKFLGTGLFGFMLLMSLCGQSLAQSCDSYSFSSNQAYTNCSSLSALNCHLHWNFHQGNNTVDIAFRKSGASTANWIAWAINPSGQRMVGSQALVAYQSNGAMTAYPTQVTSLSPSMQNGTLSFQVSNVRAEFTGNSDMIIYATLHLTSDLLSTNQVWQEGPLSGGVPGIHPTTGDNIRSVGTVNFQTGATNTSSAGPSASPSAAPSPSAGTSGQSCDSYSFSSNQAYSACSSLSALNCHLHWNFHQENNTADIAFRKSGASTTNWISWALNPSGQQMVGSQALVAYQSNGAMTAYPTQVTSLSPSMQNGTLSFQVSNVRAEFTGNSDMIIYATLHLTSDLLSTNQVWQEGPLSGGVPGIHPTTGDNIRSVGTLDFQTGTTTTGSGGNSRLRKRNTHGVLNAVSWGILMPMGVMIARYLKVFKVANPAWFYLHVSCQASAYIVGVAGFATGIKLGKDSPGVTQNAHRNMGIVIFCFGTLQLFALLLRPKPDHKYRLYWNIYHHSIGYATIILSIVNIFEGFDILDPEKKWKRAYIGVLIFLGAVAVILEALTWFIVLNRKKTERSDKHVNGTNGVNGYAARTQQNV